MGLIGCWICTAWLLGSLGGCAWLDTKQRLLVLRPTAGRPADADVATRWRPGDQRYTVPSATEPGESLALWWMPNADPAAPTLLYLHGTLRTLYFNQPKINALREAGFSVLAVDYRGWGDSSVIVPSEATIVADAWQAWGELVKRQPDPYRRVLFGHSMGGAVAIRLASQLHHGRDYGALAVESTFTRMPDVAAAAGFWGSVAAALTTLKFDSLSRVAQVDAPMLMLHGTADKTVPISVGRRLRDAAPPDVKWIEVPGATHSRLHSEAPEVYQRAFHDLQSTLHAPR